MLINYVLRGFDHEEIGAGLMKRKSSSLFLCYADFSFLMLHFLDVLLKEKEK